jgi:hypothetical protein
MPLRRVLHPVHQRIAHEIMGNGLGVTCPIYGLCGKLTSAMTVAITQCKQNTYGR